MNRKQKIVLIIGILVMVCMGLYPPWRIEMGKRFVVDEYTPSKIVSGGYALLFDPPHNAIGLDVVRLIIQCAIIAALTACIVIGIRNDSKNEV